MNLSSIYHDILYSISYHDTGFCSQLTFELLQHNKPEVSRCLDTAEYMQHRRHHTPNLCLGKLFITSPLNGSIILAWRQLKLDETNK